VPDGFRKGLANNARAHVIIPDDVQVQDFLDRCQEAGRQVLEKKIAALRTAGAGSLDLDTDQVDAVFASNCIDTRIKTMQEKARLVNQQHQASQQQAMSGLQGALASAEVAIDTSAAAQATDALAKQSIEEEVARLLMRGKFLDAVQQEVADFVGAGGGAAQVSDVPAHCQPFVFTVHARGGKISARGGKMCVCVFITAGPVIKLCAGGGGGQ
jgi:hypothetical protein